MPTELLALVASHRHAPVAIRERLALGSPRGRAALAALGAHPLVDEVVPLATCNREELYLAVSDAAGAQEAALGTLARHARLAPRRLEAHVTVLSGAEVPRHLFAVAAGLDSMVLGEAEVQGQVKRAHAAALESGLGGPFTHRLFRDAVSAGRRIRSQTEIGHARVSVSSVAVDLAGRALGGLGGRRVVVVGTGKNAELTAQALAREGASIVFVASRRHERAAELAGRYGEAVPRSRLADELARADVLLSCSASPHRVVGRALLEGRRLLAIDMAVPRDIDPAAGALPGVTLLDMDDLEREIDSRLEGRRACAGDALALVDREAARFDRWLASMEVLPAIRALRRHGDRIVAQVLAENDSRWQQLTPTDRERVEALARAVAARLLDSPTRRLEGASPTDVRLLCQLFEIDAAHEAARAAC